MSGLDVEIVTRLGTSRDDVGELEDALALDRSEAILKAEFGLIES